MGQVIDFFKKLFDSSDWPPRWHCGSWTGFHGWLYIISDLMIWSAYFAIPIVIIRYIASKKDIRFTKLYFLFAAFILACGATHFLDAVAFWIPVYRLSALVRFITGVISWITVFYLVKYLPVIFSLRSQSALEKEIEARKKAEEALSNLNASLEQKVKERTEAFRQSEGKFKRIFDAKMVGIFFWNEKGDISEANDRFLEIVGYTRQDFEDGKLQWNKMTPARYAALDAQGEKQIERTGFWQPYEKEYFRKDGSRVPVFIGAATLDKENPAKRVAYITDITERKKAEEATIASEVRYRRLFETAKDGILILDAASGEIVDVNPYLITMLGFSHAELSGKELWEIGTFKDIVASKDAFIKLQENEYIRYDNLPLKSKTGEVIQVEFVSNVYMAAGIKVVQCNIRNITERKKAEENLVKSEELYRNLFTNMLHGFAYCKTIFEDGRLTDYTHLAVNKEYEALIGLTDIAGKNMSEVIPGLLKSHPNLAQIITNVVTSGKSEKFETYIKPIKKWVAVALYSAAKGHFVSLTDDITDRKSAEQKIQNLNTELEEKVITRTQQLKVTNEELEAFSYSVSHDLRAPLRGIIGFTNILEEDYASKLDDEARRITGIIKKNTLKMGNLIDDLLSFSRLGRQQIVKTDVDTDQIIQEIIAEAAIKNNNGQVKWLIGALPHVTADPNTIRQVWVNLISNAVKYSGNNKNPVIEIGSLHKKNETIFFVKDNGVGFDDKYKDKLFKVFQRLHSAAAFEGTGVGLAIVEKIITRHGGKVWAEAVLNQGACFYFSIPDE